MIFVIVLVIPHPSWSLRETQTANALPGLTPGYPALRCGGIVRLRRLGDLPTIDARTGIVKAQSAHAGDRRAWLAVCPPGVANWSHRRCGHRWTNHSKGAKRR